MIWAFRWRSFGDEVSDEFDPSVFGRRMRLS